MIPLAPVASSKYLGRVLLASDSDFPAVVRNLRKGAIELIVTVQVFGKGGCGFPDLGKNIRGSGIGSPAVWYGDMGDDTAHCECVG